MMLIRIKLTKTSWNDHWVVAENMLDGVDEFLNGEFIPKQCRGDTISEIAVISEDVLIVKKKNDTRKRT